MVDHYNTLTDIDTVYPLEDSVLIKNVENHGQFQDIYISTGKNINLYELEQLCDSVGWVRRPLKKVKTAIARIKITNIVALLLLAVLAHS